MWLDERTNEKTTCPVCGESACRERYPDELVGRFPTVDYNFSPETRLTYQILDCLTCDHQFAVPPIDIKGLYSETHDEVYLSSKSQRQRSASDWLSIVREYAPNAKSLIDIGCSVGIFLDSASEYFDVHGVELSIWAAEIAAKRHSVSLSPLSSSPPKQRFDIATMWGVIEHLEDSKREVNAIQNALSEGGYFSCTRGIDGPAAHAFWARNGGGTKVCIFSISRKCRWANYLLRQDLKLLPHVIFLSIFH